MSGYEESNMLFEQALIRETLSSEKTRTSILAVLFGSLLITYLVLMLLFPSLHAPLFHNNPALPAVGLGLATAYELLSRVVTGRFFKKDREIPFIARYVNAFVEASLPTLAIILAARLLDPATALSSPPFLFYFLFIVLATLRLDFRLSLFTAAVAALEYGTLALVFARNVSASTFAAIPLALTRAPVILLAGFAVGFVAERVKRQLAGSFRALQERNRVMAVFGQHVSPAVAESLLKQHRELGGDVRRVTLMFLDIRGFTTYAEKRPPGEVVSYLNALFGFMIESVNRHHGIVNKFLGDGFMAVFGAPLDDASDSRHAVDASLEILSRLDELTAAGRIPSTRIGIGLDAGDAVTGTVGSAQRKEYTIIGDVVNCASRIEQLNKDFGSRLLVSHAVWEGLGDAAPMARPLGSVRVKGHDEAIQVYQLA